MGGAERHRSFCSRPWSPSGPLHTRAMMYGLSEAGDKDIKSNWTTLSDLAQDVANFLLVRGDHAYLTCGWAPCADYIGWSEELFDADYGEPVDEIRRETAPNSSVCVREWSKATVSMDWSGSYTPSIKWKTAE